MHLCRIKRNWLLNFAKIRNFSEYNEKNPGNQIMDTCNGQREHLKRKVFSKKVLSFFCVSFKPEAVFKGCNLYGFIRLDKCGTVCLKLVLMMRFMYTVRLLHSTYFLKNKLKITKFLLISLNNLLLRLTCIDKAVECGKFFFLKKNKCITKEETTKICVLV
jgi:hypothetical protein